MAPTAGSPRADRHPLAPRRLPEPGGGGRRRTAMRRPRRRTANVWAEHSVWPQDPGFRTALAGGITTLQILPGSANLIGGRSVVLKNVPSVTYQGMKFPGAPQGLKMACGENPKRVYGEARSLPLDPHGQHGRLPRAVGRGAGVPARPERVPAEARRRRQGRAKDAKPPKRDLRLDTLALPRSRARSSCTCTAIAPTRWPRCST